MFSTLYVDGESVRSMDDDSSDVRIEFPYEFAPTHRCVDCEQDLNETVDGFATESGQLTCNGYAPDGDDTEQTGPHTVEPVPLAWVNSAAIDLDSKDDSITVSISVGDPRGAFYFTISRVPDNADGVLAGRLVLHTPYPGQSLSHRPLTEYGAGTYVIG